VKARTLVLVSLLSSSALFAGGYAFAQDDECPANVHCLDYGQHVIEVDPSLGPYQAFVVESRTLTITTLDGERVERDVLLLGIARQGEGYVVDREYREERSGPFADADVGDVFALGKVAGG
jgi:hypothetical protein